MNETGRHRELHAAGGFNPGRLVILLLAAAGVPASFLIESSLDPYLLSVITFMGINVILAVSLNLTNGFTGLFSLGHPGFMAIGGYLAAILVFPAARKTMLLPELPQWLASVEWHLFPALLAGGALAALTALAIGLPVLRLKGHYLAVASLGFLIIVQVLIINVEEWTRGPLGLNGLPSSTTLWWVYLWAVLTVYVCWRVKHSSLGRSMLAMRENALAAETLGVNLTRTRMLAFVMGAFFAGVSGGLWAHLITAITPRSFSIIMAFNLVVMVVIGGSGSITGSILAACLLTMLVEVLRPIEEYLVVYGINEIIVSVALILILVFRPTGFFGTREPALLTRIAGGGLFSKGG